MIVLDTHLVSELIAGAEADRRVLTWIRSLREQPVTTALTRAELLAGAAALAPGQRRTRLVEGISMFLSTVETLPFTADCATLYAEVRERRARCGRPISTMDALIAATAKAHHASIATRDTEGFSGIGLDVVNPWTA